MKPEQPFVYLDHAATSFPKPDLVIDAVAEHLRSEAVNPGRSGFDRAVAAARRLDALRAELARFFGARRIPADRVVFAANATDALNLALQGLLHAGDHVVSTVTEHNSVLRPLEMLSRRIGVSHDLAGCDERGLVHVESIAELIRPATRLVVVNHASNVVGTIQPVAEIGKLCRERGLLLLVDAAQTAGQAPIRMDEWNIDLLAFTGHKSLHGPTGTGGLVVGERADPDSSRWGGTGVRSAEPAQPADFPYRLEAGTLNAAGLAGLAAGLQWLARRGPELAEAPIELAARFVEGCRRISGLRLLGLSGDEPFGRIARTPVVSLCLESLPPHAVGEFLDAEWNIAVRTGLHCAPRIHQALGTAPDGAVRFSFGASNTPGDVARALEALESLAAG